MLSIVEPLVSAIWEVEVLGAGGLISVENIKHVLGTKCGVQDQEAGGAVKSGRPRGSLECVCRM